MPELASETGSGKKTQGASKPSAWTSRVTGASRTQRILPPSEPQPLYHSVYALRLCQHWCLQLQECCVAFPDDKRFNFG
jgi:hypothetical protein